VPGWEVHAWHAIWVKQEVLEITDSLVYTDDYSIASQNLKLTIKLLAKHNIPVSPIYYQVGYDIVSERNNQLKEALDRLLESQDQQISEQNFLTLFQQFLAPDDQAVEAQRQQLQQMIDTLQSGFSHSKGEMSEYLESLNSFSDVLSEVSEPDEIGMEVQKVRQNTQKMEQSQRQLGSNMAEMLEEIDSLRLELDRAREESLTDALTNLANRKAFDQRLNELIDDSEDNPAFSVIIADIDFFKKFNDTYGHLVGDKVLKYVGRILKSGVKGKDLAARFGGEEFTLLLPNTDINGAKAVAEQLRVAIADQNLIDKSVNEDYGKVTVSLGVGQYRPGETNQDLLERADKALYVAKENGRNRVEIAE
jgi:diguanylate cyclase